MASINNRIMFLLRCRQSFPILCSLQLGVCIELLLKSMTNFHRLLIHIYWKWKKKSYFQLWAKGSTCVCANEEFLFFSVRNVWMDLGSKTCLLLYNKIQHIWPNSFKIDTLFSIVIFLVCRLNRPKLFPIYNFDWNKKKEH